MTTIRRIRWAGPRRSRPGSGTGRRCRSSGPPTWWRCPRPSSASHRPRVPVRSPPCRR
ncbi:hypothetical protein ACFFX0_27430 [Citricoccus parietis]|uniref:Uncharacterized protein n=1 Tax=Citricoccus parietis TaxID=592307 RepID=A0ABV5G6Z2_9MICC